MSEIKRVPLVSFNAEKVTDKKCQNVGKTVRISLGLSRTEEDTCPMYNYKEELTAAKKKDKAKNGIDKTNHTDTNGLDPYGENDDECRRLAMQFEARYGTGNTPTNKRKRKGRKDDYADIGMGYDESDSFIDNTDGYDEIIPQNVTTLHGGFYINCGALEFKTDDEASSNISSSSSSEDEDNDGKKKHNRKRILDSDSDEGMEVDKPPVVPQMKKQKMLPNGMVKLKKKFLTPDKLKLKKKRIMMPPADRKLPTNNRISELRDPAVNANVDNNKVMEVDQGRTEENGQKEDLIDKKRISLDNITDVINSVAKGKHNNNSLLNMSSGTDVSVTEMTSLVVGVVGRPDDDVTKVTKSAEVVETATHQLSPSLTTVIETPTVITEVKTKPPEDNKEMFELPTNLPNDILLVVEEIKVAAAKNIASNVSMFSSHVKNLILSFERKSKCLGKQSRSKVYQHLSGCLNCKKESLIKRAKIIISEDDELKLSQFLEQLKIKINDIMPALRESYEQNCQLIVQRKFSSTETEEAKNVRMPKKTFPWTDDMKKWIREMFTIKRRLLIAQGIQKETLDAHLQVYLKHDIQQLWPDSWVSLNYLVKLATFEKKPSLPPPPAIKPPVEKQPDSTGVLKINNHAPPSVAKETTVIDISTSVTAKKENNKLDVVYNQLEIDLVKPPPPDVSVNPSIKTDNKIKVPSSIEIIPKSDRNSTKSKTDKIEKSTTDNKITIKPVENKLSLKPVENSKISVKSMDKLTAIKTSEKPKIADNNHFIASVNSDIVRKSTEITEMNIERKSDTKKTIQEILKMAKKPTVMVPNDCQIIDLTASAMPSVDVSLKRKPGPKSKTRPHELAPGASIITATGNCDPLIAAIKSVEILAGNNSNGSGIGIGTSKISEAGLINVKSELTNMVTSTPIVPKSDAEIEQVMEELKALQQMASPTKQLSVNHITSTDTSSSSIGGAAVSVIALNKNYANSGGGGGNSNTGTAAAAAGANASNDHNFQDAFQRQFIATTPTSSRTSTNNHDKFSTYHQSQNKFSSSTNNNFEQQNSTKLKNAVPSSQKSKQPSSQK